MKKNTDHPILGCLVAGTIIFCTIFFIIWCIKTSIDILY